MKTYNLEVDFFDASRWERISVDITSISIIQLIRTFLHETSSIYEHGRLTQNRKQMQRELWYKNKEYITIEELKFPIINRRT